MIRRLIIAGGRDIVLTVKQLEWITDLLPIVEVVSGGARGVDSCGELWAKEHGVAVKIFLPNYDRSISRIAPLIRNEKMAFYADALAIFPGGRGSADILRRAKAHCLKIYDFRKGRQGFFE